MAKRVELIVRSGGMIAVLANGAVNWRCLFCPTATRGFVRVDGHLAALDAMREHLLAEHADLLTDTDRAALGEPTSIDRIVPTLVAPAAGSSVVYEFESHRTDCALITQHREECTCRGPDGGT